MSKIVFEDKSSVEVRKSNEPGKIVISIQATDGSNPLKKIVNSVEITSEEFKSLIKDIK